MLHGRRLYALVPARGGSKGIPRKNLYKLGGTTLVELALLLGKACRHVDKVYVSTDDAETQLIAEGHACTTPSPRPAELSTDQARAVDVLRHLVEQGTIGSNDCVILLQPTSPLRTVTDIEAVCDVLEKHWEKADAVVSVCKIDGPHPYKAQIIRDGYLSSLLDRNAGVPRQLLPDVYIPNGAFYLGKVRSILGEVNFIPQRSLPYVMSQLASVNLDGTLDLMLLEALVEKGVVQVDNGRVIIGQTAVRTTPAS